MHLLSLFVDEKTKEFGYNLNDDIIAAALVTLNGEMRLKK
jgi:NAD/NADP transhydrogenase alpha subunit